MDVAKLLKTGLKLTNILSFFIWSVASAVPQDGTVVAGSANISQPNSQQTIINQSSQSAVINWSSFNTASTESVLFHQPNSSSIALNKITNGLPTNFNGNLSANGQVWIINPAGVLFGSTSNINVAGLVATTNSINNNNFMAGNYIFEAPSDLSASIINNGNINISNSGIAVLVGPNVINNGSIIANLGTVQLSTGGAFVLDLYGDNLINFGSNSPIQNGSVENNNLISATGGKVYMTANAAAGILDNVVSMSGTIQASSAAVNRNGEIILNGGNSGTVRVSGKLIAHKGHIETSGHVLVLDSNAVIDASGGSWLIDPWNITVVSSAGTCTNIGCTQPFTPTGTNSQIGSNLIVNQLNANTDVTLYTGGANGGTDAGSITISAPITANSGSGSLTLQADYNVIINQPININGNFSAVAGLTTPSGNIQIGANITTVGTQEYFSPVALTVNPVTLTATGATNSDITFDSTIDGPGGLVVTTPGNIFFFDAIGQGTALSSLATTSGAGVFTVISGNVKTTGAQTYTGDVDLSPNTPPMTLQGSTIEIKNNMVAGLTVDLTINGNLLMDLNSNLGGIGSNVRSLTVTGSSTIGGAINTSTGNETFTGPVTVNGSALFDTNTSGNIIFQSTIEGPGSAAIYSAGSIVFNNTVGLSTALASLTAVANTIDIKNASNTTSFSTAGTQDIQASSGGILLDTLNSITFNAPGQTIDFVGPMDSYSATTPLQTDVVVNGNLFYVEGIHNTPSGVGEKYNLSNYTSVKSFDVTGTSILGASVNSVLQSVNIRTLNNQTYAQSVQLGGTNQNVTSVNGNVTFQGALNGDQFNTQNFTVSAASGIAEFDGVVGSVSHYLANLSVTGNQINITSGATAFTTNGTQTFNGPVTLGTSTVLTSNAGGITFNGTVDGGFDLTTIANSLTIGVVTFNGVVGGTTPLASLTSTVPGNLIGETDVNTTLIHTTGTQTYSGAVIVENPTNPTNVNFSGSTISFNDALLQGSASTTNPVNITISGNFSLIGPNGNVQTAGGSTLVNSLHVTGTSIFSNPNASNGVNTLGNQNYDGLVTLNPGGLSSFATVFFATHTSGSAITFGTNTPSVTALQSNGGSPGGAKFILSAGTILNFDGIVGGVGGSNPLSTITIVGASSTTNINTTQINTTGAQIYGGAVIVGDGVSAVLTSTTAGMTFSSTVDALTNGGESLQLIALNPVVLTGNIGSTHPLSALTIGSNSVATEADINTSVIPTTALQKYWGPVVIDNTSPTLTASNAAGAITFESTVDGLTSGGQNLTAVAGTAGSPGTVTFNGVVGGGEPINILTIGSGTIATTTDINTNEIMTVGDQFYDGPVVLLQNTGITSTTRSIFFARTIDGGFDLALNAVNNGVTFNGVVGGSVPLNTLTDTAGLTLISTNHIKTVGTQIYNGIEQVQNQTSMMFESTNLTGTFIGFGGGALQNGGTAADITINGNFTLLAGGSLSVSPPAGNVKSLNVIGTTYISDAATINTQNNQLYHGDVTLGGGSDAFLETLNSGATVHFFGAVKNDGGPLTGLFIVPLGSFSPVVIFDGQIGNSNSVSDLANIKELSVTGSSITMNAGNVFTTDGQNYSGPMTLSKNTVLDSITANSLFADPGIILDGTVNALTTGGESLQLIAAIPVQLNGNIGTTHALSALTIGTNIIPTEADINTTAITTTTSQIYNGPVVLGSNATLNTTGSGVGTFILFNNSITGAHNLTVDPALITFDGAVDTTSLTASATEIDINTGSIHTTADQNYTGAVVLGANVNSPGLVSDNGSINFSSTINGAFDLAISVGGTGNVLFSNNVGALTPLTSLSVTAASGDITVTGATSGAMIKTTGTQTYNGLVAVDNQTNPANFTFWSTDPANITFKNTLAANANANPVNITIDGNFVLANPNGNLNTSLGGPFINSFHVTGTSTFSSTALFHGVVTDGNQTYDGPVFLSGLNVNTELSTQTAGGVITFNSTVESLSGHSGLTIDLLTPTSILNFDGTVGAGSNFLGFLTVRGSSSAQTNINTSQINTAGTQNYKGPVSLGVSTVLDSAFGSGGAIIFQNTVTGNAHDLTLISPIGSTDAVKLNGNITGLNSLTVGSNSIATEADINTSVITTTGLQQYYGPVVLGANSTLTSNSGNITFGGTLNGTFNLTANAASGIVTFGGIVGATPLNNLTVTGTADINTTAITTANNQLFNNAVVLGANSTLTSNSGSITFGSTVDGGFNLTTNASAGGGEVIFSGQVGFTTPLAALTVTSGNLTDINTTLIKTVGTQIFNSPIQIENPSNPTAMKFWSTSGAVDFKNSVTTGSTSGANPVDVTVQGDFILDTPSGAMNVFGFAGVLNSLTVTGMSTFNSGLPVITVGNQDYQGAVIINANTNFSTQGGGVITFGSTVDGPGGAHPILLQPTSSVNFDGIVGGSTPLSFVTVTGSSSATTNINTTQINTTGAQSYGEKVVLGSDTVLTSTSAGIHFSSTVDSDGTSRALTLDAFLPTVLSGNIGNISILKSLEIINEADINTDLIRTTTSQSYDGAVILGVSTILITPSPSGLITFASTIDSNINGPWDLTVNTSTAKFKGIIGGSSNLMGALTVNADIINFDNNATSITTSGIQSYTGNIDMTIGLDPVFTAPSFVIGVPVVILADTTYTSTTGDIDFQKTVDGPANLILNPTGSAIFEGDVGAITPLASLIINGPLNISGATVINTDNYQTYNALVTLNNNIVMNAGTSGCTTPNCVKFTLGTIGVDGITGPTHNLSIFTYDFSKGANGDGIAGTVNVANFTMGGSGGGEISPNVSDWSTVGSFGDTGVVAWNNTKIDTAATGKYCVNGFCISGTRQLIITTSDDSKTYGQVFTPTLFSTTGVAPGDNVTGIPPLTSAGDPATANVGSYQISVTNNLIPPTGPGIANHYASFTYVNTGLLTVNPAPLTISANNTSKTYGQTVTFTGLPAEFTVVGLLNTDTVASVTLNSAGAPATASVLGSPYSIVPSAAVGTGLNNYTITYDTTGLLTVNTAPLTITSTSQTKNYGDNLSSTTTSFISTPLQNGETISTVDILSAGLPPTATVLGSPYQITAVSNAVGTSGFDPNNYAITYVPAGNITVNPAPLTITSNSQTKLFGTELPSVTTDPAAFSATGLQNGETIGQVTITSLGLPSTAPVGTYAITDIANATGGNFDITNYLINYVHAGNIFVVSSLMPAIPNNVVQVQIFEPPVFPVCGPSGCDNLVIDSFLPPVTTEYLNNINYCDETACNTPEIFNQITTGEIACFANYKEILDSKFYRVHVTRDPRTKEPCWICEKYPENIKVVNNIKIKNKSDNMSNNKVMYSKNSDLKDTSKTFEKHWWHYPLSDRDLFMR